MIVLSGVFRDTFTNRTTKSLYLQHRDNNRRVYPNCCETACGVAREWNRIAISLPADVHALASFAPSFRMSMLLGPDRWQHRADHKPDR
jgi:hypothetical protein